MAKQPHLGGPLILLPGNRPVISWRVGPVVLFLLGPGPGRKFAVSCSCPAGSVHLALPGVMAWLGAPKPPAGRLPAPARPVHLPNFGHGAPPAITVSIRLNYPPESRGAG